MRNGRFYGGFIDRYFDRRLHALAATGMVLASGDQGGGPTFYGWVHQTDHVAVTKEVQHGVRVKSVAVLQRSGDRLQAVGWVWGRLDPRPVAAYV